MKKLIALAVAGAFIAPAAFADSKNVEIYGIATAGLEKTNDGREQVDASNTTAVGQTRVTDYGSRIGFKGSEDLGGGLKAIFKIESKVALDVGGTTLASREGQVGLAGNFGAVLAGRGKTPYQLTTEIFDPFNANDTLYLGGGANNVTTYVDRANNWVAYASPNVQGLEVVGAYVFGEDKTASKKAASAISVSAKYTLGDLVATGAVQQYKDYTTDGNKSTDVIVGATYAMGPLGLAGAITTSKKDETDTKRTSLLVNATYGMGAVTAKAGVISYGKTDVAGTKADDAGTKLVVGGQYDLSKRTNAFAEYASTSKKVAGTSSAANTLSVGVVHMF